MPATERPPWSVQIAAIAAYLARGGERCSLAAAGHAGRRIARILGDAHASVDAEGNLAPRIHGRLGPETARVDAEGEVHVEEPASDAEGDLLAPEIAQGGRLTPRADVYGLAAIVRALLAPGDRGSLRAMRPDLPTAVADALDRALDPRPSHRRITAVELEAWLASLDAQGTGLRELAELAARVAEAAPAAREHRSARERPLSPLASAVVALTTAAVVFAAGVLVAEHLVAADSTVVVPPTRAP